MEPGEEDEHTVHAGHEILRLHYSYLRESAIEPAPLGAELLARGMIGADAEWDSRQTTENPANRRSALVGLVMKQIALKKLGAFEIFLQALAKEPQNKHICDKLIRECHIVHIRVLVTVTATFFYCRRIRN